MFAAAQATTAPTQATTAPTVSPSVRTEKMQTQDIAAQTPAYNLQDVSVSFNLVMHPADMANCYNDGGKGLWSRDVFRFAAGQAFNVHSEKVQEMEAAAGGNSLLINGKWMDAQHFVLTPNEVAPGDAWVPNIYDSIRFDRVVESSYPSFNLTAEYNDEQFVHQLRDKSQRSLPPNYWNVYVRFTFLDVPTEVVVPTAVNPLGFRSFISRLAKSPTLGEYTNPTLTGAPGGCPGTIVIPSSIWISTEDNFLPDRVEPVLGRGKKAQNLLIPLIMGIVCMLFIPFLVVACLVSIAETQNEYNAKISEKETEVTKHERTVANLDEKLAVFHASEQNATDKQKAKNKQAAEELAYELSERDVQWIRDEKAPLAKYDE